MIRRRRLTLADYVLVTVIYVIIVGFTSLVFFTAKKSAAEEIVDAPPQAEAGADACAHLYNVGRSREWRECMGVGPK